MTDDEIAALEAAAAAMREAGAVDADCGCAARSDVLARLAEAGHKRASYLCSFGDACCALQAASVRAIPIPNGDALAAALAQARREGIEAAIDAANKEGIEKGSLQHMVLKERYTEGYNDGVVDAVAAIRALLNDGGNDAQ